MSYGLKCWDASGNLAVDISDRLTRLSSSHSGTASYWYTEGVWDAHVLRAYITVPGLANDGTWFVSHVTWNGSGTLMGFLPFFLSGQLEIHFMVRGATSGTFAVDVMRA
jgi:hypothetical protein